MKTNIFSLFNLNRRGSGVNLNRTAMRVALIGLFISLGIGNAWAYSYYAKVTASANPTGAGSVYVKANAKTGATTGDGASATSPNKQNTNYNFALLAETGYGYEFSQWALGANPSGGTQSLTNAGSRTTAYVTAKTKNSDGTLSYTVTANFNRRAIEAVGDPTVTSLSSAQTWRSHANTAKVDFQDKYVLNQSDITITYPSDIATVTKTLSWTKGTNTSGDGSATTNGKMTVSLGYDFSNPTNLVHNPIATMTVREQSSLGSPLSSIDKTSSAVAIGLDLTPVFSTDKTSYTFPATEVNTSAQTTISATSYGDLPVGNAKCAWSYALTGANADQFGCSVSGGVATVTYHPNVAASHTATLTMTAKWTDADGMELSYNAPDITINGSATAPDFTISNLNYATTTDIGTAEKTLTLQNVSYVTSANIAFSGDNASCFSATSYNTTTKSFDITFTAPVSGGRHQEGTYTATATVTGTASASSAVHTATLTAVVSPAPPADFTVPNAITFNNGEDMESGTTDDQTITLTNMLNVVGTPTISIAGTDASMYSVQGGYDGENNAFTIRFTASGTKGGKLTANATVTVENYDGVSVSKTVELNAFMEEVVSSDVRVTNATGGLVDECDWAKAIKDYQVTGYTFTLLRHVDLGTITATNNITKAITIDLNGKTLRAAVNATSVGILTITAAVELTIKDSRGGGKIINEIARNSEVRTIFVNKAGAILTLESGTITVNNLGQYASAAATVEGVSVAKYASCQARAIHQIAGSMVNINGGKVEAFGSRNVYGIVQAGSVATNTAGTSVLNINGGEVYAEAAYQAYGVLAYGLVNMEGGMVTGKTNTNLVDASYSATTSDPNLRNGNARGIDLGVGTANATATSNYFATLNMTGGTVKAINERVNAVDKGRAYGIIFDSSNATQADKTKTPDGTNSQKVTAVGSITGGKIEVNTGTYYGFGVYATGSYNSYDDKYNTIQLKNCTIDVTAHTYATGVMAFAAVGSANGAEYAADIEMTNCTVTATTTVGAYAEAAYVSSTYGTIYENGSYTAYKGEYAAAAKLTINSGTYTSTTATSNSYCIKAASGISSEEIMAKTIYGPKTNVALQQEIGGHREEYPTLIIHGGTFTANTTNTKNAARAVHSAGHTTIDGGTFTANASGTTAYALYAVCGTLKVSGAEIHAEANSTAYGILVTGGITDYTMFEYAAEAELNNLDVTATTRTGTEARGVVVATATKTQTEATRETLKTNGTASGATSSQKNAYKNYYNIYQIAEKAVAAKAKINGGTYRANAATTTAYGAVISTTAVSTTGAASASAEGEIKNATFISKTVPYAESTATTTAYGIFAGGPTTIDGCDITVQPTTTTGYGVYINDKKTTLSNTKIAVTTANTADATKSAAAYGVYNNASISSIGWIFEGELEANEGNVVEAQTTSGTTAYGIWTHAVYKAITSEVYTAAGTYPAAARTVINGGKYTANANNTTAYALGVQDPQRSGDVAAIPTCIVNGGNFKGTATTTPYADVSVNGETGYFVLNGGYYVKDENLDKKLGEEKNKVAVKSGTPEYAEGYRWHVTGGMTGEAVCKITQNSTAYASLEEALQVVNASPNSTWTIVMIANATLSKGDYEIPANTTLLIPYKSNQTTANGTTPAWVNKNSSPTPGTPYPYLKLTFANGVNMTVKGKIEASSTTYINQSNWTGVPGGAFGWLQLNEGSNIDLESGAYLFAWGYVTGKGEINAKNGSFVYEDFQMGDWRGGTMGSSVNGNKNGLGSKGVFLLTDYYFQNVECPIIYRPGAQSIAYSGAYMEKSVIKVDAKSDPVVMVGTSNSMFLMNPATAGEDTWVRKEYDAEKDQLVWTLNSGASIGSFTLKLNTAWMDVDMNTSDYVLPMATNFKIVANEGDINVTNDVCFLPGSEATIKKEAKMVVASGKRVFFYDSDDWSSYGGYYHKVGYSPSWKACPRTASKLADAKIEIAGTLDVQGAIYTTAGGGNIFSTRENAGKVKLSAAAPASTSAIADFTGNSGQNKTLCQLVGNGSEGHYVGKALTSAKLKNEDGAYTPTAGSASGDIYAYMEDPADGVFRWLSVRDNGCFTEIKGADTKQYIHPSDFVAVEENANGDHAYHNEGSTRYFVNAVAASTSASCVWWEAEPKGIIDGVTYYMANNENFDNYGTYFYWDNSVSYWKPKKITVIWKDKDGNKITNGSYGDLYNFNTSPQFFGANPVWANTSTEKHDWIGWRDEAGNIYDKNATLPVATGDVTYIAYFQTSKYQYTITFKNENDNKVIWAGLLDAGDPAVCPVEPTQASTVSTVYTFTNWVGYAEGDNLPAVTGPATYTAHYAASTRQYHVTFYNYDAATVLYEADVDYNTTRPVYGGVTPFRSNTSAYSYEWTGWQQGATHYGTTDNLALVTGDVYYVATFSQTTLKYQVLFKRQDESIIDAPFFEYEETPAAFPANPTMASTVSTNYTFDHWDPAELVPVTEDGKVYTAYFSESPRQYTAHFVNYDGTSLGVDQAIDYNTIPEYTGETPFKPNDSRNSFEFSGWAWEAGADWEAGSIAAGEAFPAIKGDITFTAQFTPVLLQFNVIYQREDGTIIEQQKKKWGESTAFPSVSNYEDATHTYTFDHWSPATVVTPVTTDATYTAYFNQAIKTYSISNFGISPAGYGTVSPASLSGIPGGSAVTVNGNKITVNGTDITATPTAATAQYTYAFDHWNNVPATVTGNVTNIEAVFTRTVNSYTVTWKNADGTTLETDENVPYGNTPEYNGETPTKADDDDYTYTFDGWDPALATVTEEATYTAQFTPVSKETGNYLNIVGATATTLTINANPLTLSKWPYTINGTKYRRADGDGTLCNADRTITITHDKAADAQLTIIVLDKTDAVVSHRNYTVPYVYDDSNATLDETNANSIVFVNSGTLTVNGTRTAKAIYVEAGAELNVTGTLNVTKLVLRTTPWTAAVLTNNGTINATNTYYSRVVADNSQFYQFGLPCSSTTTGVIMSDGSTPSASSWQMKEYSESKRAEKGVSESGENWVALSSTTIEGGKGYEIYSGSKYYREYCFPITIAEGDAVRVWRTGDDKTNSGWNIIVSPKMGKFIGEPKPEDITITVLQPDGGYIQEIPEVIMPAVPFSYQASATGMLTFESTLLFNASAPAPRRKAVAEETERIQWIHLDIADANGSGDQTSIYSHPTRYDAVYQTGIDVAKQSLTASRAIIYSSHAYGEMAFAGVADTLLEQGVALTVYSPIAQELTISMRENDWLNRMAYVWLVDHETGARTDLLWDTYTFDATEGTARGRFTIEGVFRAPQITTDIENAEMMNDEMMKVRKVLINQKMYIIRGDQMYDATGKKVSK